MAGLACHQCAVIIFGMQSQAEAGRRSVREKFAIQARRFPAIRAMASSAVAVKHAFMNFGFGMAPRTVRRGLLEALDGQLAHHLRAAYQPLAGSMALHTLHLGMPAL